MHGRLLAALALVAAPLHGQGAATPPADGSAPASSNVRGAQWPRVHPDGRVTFRLRAPGAQRVQLNPAGAGLGAAPLDMVRGADSAWTVTTAPAVPGFHYYWFLVDGVMVQDPSSETFFGWGRPTSGVEVPEPGVDWYDARDVPHGEVRVRWYHSRVTGAWRRAYVYTPPGYDASPSRRYPVLYLQHGAGEDERGWTTQGRANFILDNLIAERRAVPMLVVMDQGYATRPGPQPALPPGTPLGGAMAPGSAFEDVILTDVIPMIDATYRTAARREQRAIAGLSMGGGQALQIGLAHLDRFAWVAAFSGAGVGRTPPEQAYGGVFADAKAFDARVRLLYLGAGTEETQFHDGAKALQQGLERLGVRHSVFVPSPGTAHEWQTWRRALHDLAPRLFR